MENQILLFPQSEHDVSENTNTFQGKPRLLKACRNQIEMQFSSLDQLIDENHVVRFIWNYVEQLDLSKALNKICAVEGNAGRPAVDPKILVALWLYATVEGIGSARVVGRYCSEHLAFQWICGGIEIDRKTISNFRTQNGDLFDELLAKGVTVLMKAGIVKLEEIAHDGIRVRASAGKDTFRREKTLKELHLIAQDHVAKLKQELEANPAKSITRQEAARKRAAEEKNMRLEAALQELQSYQQEIDRNRIKHGKKKLSEEEKTEIRVSTTDPEARNMKMASGGFRAGYSFQYAIDVNSGYMVGANVINAGTDGGQILPMFQYIKDTFNVIPKRYLADGGYKNQLAITTLFEEGCNAYIPLHTTSKSDKYAPRSGENEAITKWRERMGEAESKEIYMRRASTIEWFNAGARRRGLYQVVLRGLKKTKIIATLHAIVHNMLRAISHKIV